MFGTWECALSCGAVAAHVISLNYAMKGCGGGGTICNASVGGGHRA